MTQSTHPANKAELLAVMDGAWNDLQATIDSFDEDVLVNVRDPAGWSAKDHLAHLAAWERSVLVMIRDGRPQWEGLGIDQALFDRDGYDEKNEVIRQQSADWSLARARGELASVHQATLDVLGQMSDQDLQKPCSEFVPGAPDFPVFGKIDGNTGSHFNEHRVWIVELLATAGDSRT